MSLSLWIALAVLAAALAVVLGRATAHLPTPAKWDVRSAPRGAMAVLVNRKGQVVSRVKLQESRNSFVKYHGKQQADVFRHVGQRPDGDYEFRVVD